MVTIQISDETNARLASIAKPLEDTHDTVIVRLLDKWQTAGPELGSVVAKGHPIETLGDGRMIFAAANPPDLEFTTCQQIVIDGDQLPKNQTYWNNLVYYLVLKMHNSGMKPDHIRAMLNSCNSIDGRKTNSGYRYIEEVDFSIQGQDSNGAFRQAFQIILLSGLHGDIFFEWRNNSKAAFPNKRGHFKF